MEDIEERVFDAIQKGNTTNAAIRIALGFNINVYNPAVDRALQRLRKANRIRMAGVPRRWCIGGVPKTCPTCKGSGRI